jgi:hypothetical protein
VCGQREHAAELAAAEHAEHGVRKNHDQKSKVMTKRPRQPQRSQRAQRKSWLDSDLWQAALSGEEHARRFSGKPSVISVAKRF